MSSKTEENKSWLTKKFNQMSVKAGIKAFSTFLPTLKNLAKMAEPKMIRYFQGYDEETNTKGEERIILMKLTKDKKRVMVNVLQAPKVRLQIKEGAVEDIHDINDWIQQFVEGGLDGEVVKME